MGTGGQGEKKRVTETWGEIRKKDEKRALFQKNSKNRSVADECDISLALRSYEKKKWSPTRKKLPAAPRIS